MLVWSNWKKRADALEKIFYKKIKLLIFLIHLSHKKNIIKSKILVILILNIYKLIIIAVPHSELIKIIKNFHYYNNYLLIEKPLGKNLKEALKIKKILKNNLENTFVGFNHRFYDCIMEAHKFLNKKKEKIISLKIDFGHGGSPDDLKSWKKNLQLNGGGAIFDPGIHLIDLISYFDGGHKIKFINKLEWRGFGILG